MVSFASDVGGRLQSLAEVNVSGRKRNVRNRRRRNPVPTGDGLTRDQQWKLELEREHDARTLAVLSLPAQRPVNRVVTII